MPTKGVSMDRVGTVGPAMVASVDLSTPFVYQRPADGLDWFPGVRTSRRRPFQLVKDVFLLAERRNPWTEVELPSDLHLTFSALRPEPKSILGFAQNYGLLKLVGSHFHPEGDLDPQDGEAFSDWKFEICRHRTVQELWHAANDPKGLALTMRFLEQIPKLNAEWPRQYNSQPLIVVRKPARTDNVIELARDIVVCTINAALTPNIDRSARCVFPGCGVSEVQEGLDYTEAVLRQRVSDRQLELVVTPTNLKKALWLQVAGMVAGQRVVKKCQAPDCGGYMDVTTSQHPGARRMHPWCAERLRKRRYRQRLIASN